MFETLSPSVEIVCPPMSNKKSRFRHKEDDWYTFSRALSLYIRLYRLCTFYVPAQYVT
ncbi:MAG: hypothetical protein NVSMB44_37290 [Ktedonobacteraceae bacterium]